MITKCHLHNMCSNTELDLGPMTTNMDELEKKMEIKFEGVRAMMVDGFSKVDHKLTAIEELLKKVVEAQNRTGNILDKKNGNVTEKNMRVGGTESRINHDDGKTITIRGRDGGPSHESRLEKPWRAEISRDDDDQETNGHIWSTRGWLHHGDQNRQTMPQGAGSPHGWVGLYTHHYGKDGPKGTNFGRVKDFCGPFGGLHVDTVKREIENNCFEGSRRTQRGREPEEFGKKVAEADETGWVGKKSENDTEKGWSSLGKEDVKTSQDEIFKDHLKIDWQRTKESWVGSSDKVADKTDTTKEEEDQTGSWASWGNKMAEKTDASLQDSLNYDQCDKKDSDSWSKAMHNVVKYDRGSVGFDEGRDWSKLIEENSDSKHGWGAWGEKGNNKPLAQVTNEGSNEKDQEESQKPGSWGRKGEGLGPKRKQPDSSVEGQNDGPISSGPLTATRQRLDVFTTDEQEILNEIEPIMQSISSIMHQGGYNDGDPLSADHQTYILDNVFIHHPKKTQKSGAGVDYIMISKYKNIQGTRCFYVVSMDGRKEDFSYHKCMQNFVRGKYPDKADEFIPKYFKNSKPCRKMGRGSGPDEARVPRSWSGWNHVTRVPPLANEDRTRSPAWQPRRAVVGTKQKKARWRPKLSPG